MPFHPDAGSIMASSSFAAAVTPSTDDLQATTRGISVNTAGAVSYQPAGYSATIPNSGDASVSMEMLAGVIYPIQAIKITAGTGVIAHW